MALVPISDYLTTIPDARGTQVAVPVSAGVLGGIADSLNHDVGWRQRRAGHWIVGRRHDYANGGALTEDPTGKAIQTYPLVFTPDTRAEYLQVIISYQCNPSAAASARVLIWLTTLPGASVDGSSVSPAFVWQVSDGTLSTSRVFDRFVAAGSPVYRYPVLHATTRDIVDDTPSTPTTPRCLNLGAFAGLNLALWVKEQDARVLSVTVKELYKEMVDQ